jgi:ABC-type multidrug transport system permease subunit
MGNIPVFLEDRYDAVNNYASGRFSFGTYCLAQFVAAIPWQLMCSTVFTLLIYWIPFYNWDISGDPDAFFFAICTSFLMMITQEAVNWCLIELLQSDMLTTTAAMTILGTFFMMAGFFIKIKDMPWGTRWMAYTVPSKYVFPGHLFNFFDGQDFKTPTGSVIPGDIVVEKYFNVDYRKYGSWRKWMDLLIGFAFVVQFRYGHFMLLKMKNGDLGGSLPTSDGVARTTWAPPANAHNDMPEEVTMKASAKPSSSTSYTKGLSAKSLIQGPSSHTSVTMV